MLEIGDVISHRRNVVNFKLRRLCTFTLVVRWNPQDFTFIQKLLPKCFETSVCASRSR